MVCPPSKILPVRASVQLPEAKSIRIPVTWMQHAGSAPSYTVDPAWMNRVQQFVDWSLQAGLYVMINMHHDSWQWVNTMPTNHDAVLAEYKTVWTQIAKEFGDTFAPHYTNNTIAIKPTFFAETNGGTINLTFHFWSGQILKYQLTMKGNRVSGTPM